jgi:hypothetical protein
MPCQSHPPWLHHPNNISWSYKLWRSSLCSILQPPASSALLDQNILISLGKNITKHFTTCQSHDLQVPAKVWKALIQKSNYGSGVWYLQYECGVVYWFSKVEVLTTGYLE